MMRVNFRRVRTSRPSYFERSYISPGRHGTVVGLGNGFSQSTPLESLRAMGIPIATIPLTVEEVLRAEGIRSEVRRTERQSTTGRDTHTHTLTHTHTQSAPHTQRDMVAGNFP